LLLAPYIAMQFEVEGVRWTAIDFIAAGIMLFGGGAALEIALRIVKTITYRVIACAVILFALAVVWAELAVGIIGTPLAGS
jgi:hypothetical protein